MARIQYDLPETLQMMPIQFGQVVITPELRDTIVEELERLYQMEEDVTGAPEEREEMLRRRRKAVRNTIN